MAKIIVEVGSTCTKIDKYDVNSIKRIKEKTIQFKKHYNEEGKLSDIDVKELIDCIIVAEEIGAKYIIPTDISMVYGIIDKKINLKESKI